MQACMLLVKTTNLRSNQAVSHFARPKNHTQIVNVECVDCIPSNRYSLLSDATIHESKALIEYLLALGAWVSCCYLMKRDDLVSTPDNVCQ